MLEAMIAGESMLLDSNRAIYWPSRRWLMVADLHLGKASLMRQAGVPLPRGTTTRDLDRLAALVVTHRPRRLIVLGDLIHGDEQRDAPWLSAFSGWRDAHAGLELTLVAGNHDRHMHLASFGFEVVESLHARPFMMRHDAAGQDSSHAIAGHLHPGADVRDGRVKTRWPAFWLGPKRTLLPAFGSLTGLAPFAAPAGDEVIVVTPGGLLATGNPLRESLRASGNVAGKSPRAPPH